MLPPLCPASFYAQYLITSLAQKLNIMRNNEDHLIFLIQRPDHISNRQHMTMVQPTCRLIKYQHVLV